MNPPEAPMQDMFFDFVEEGEKLAVEVEKYLSKVVLFEAWLKEQADRTP